MVARRHDEGSGELLPPCTGVLAGCRRCRLGSRICLARAVAYNVVLGQWLYGAVQMLLFEGDV
jgi:hypothetical protein